MTGALHVRGVLLPDGEERDLWVVDGRLTFEPVAQAETVSAGDWVDRAEGDLTPLWPADALRAAVARAHAAGARVAVHVFSEEALPDLIDAGVDSVEHGTGLTEDLVAALAASGAALVPTLINID